jgi:hypothetical protein
MTAETDRFITSLAGHKLGYRETLATTYMLTRDVIERQVPGDFAEAGVYAGAECAVMARAIMDHPREYKRRVHLFDSFQGIPQPGPEDSEFMTAGNPAGDACCPMEDVQKNMRAFGIPDELLVYHPGWFADTMPGWTTQLALLRLDGDLYESTKTALTHLYPTLVRAGWLIVDDYPLSGCRKALQECVGYLQPGYWQRL